MALALMAPLVVGLQQPNAQPPQTKPPAARSITDVIHRTIDLPPLLMAIVDTPEYQRLRNVGQLGTASWVYPCAVHDRFQHSLGVAHLAQRWAKVRASQCARQAKPSHRPTRPDPSQPNPTQPDPTQPNPTRPDPTQPDPTQPNLT